MSRLDHSLKYVIDDMMAELLAGSAPLYCDYVSSTKHIKSLKMARESAAQIWNSSYIAL